jgi:hypothetical protein
MHPRLYFVGESERSRTAGASQQFAVTSVLGSSEDEAQSIRGCIKAEGVITFLTTIPHPNTGSPHSTKSTRPLRQNQPH